MTAIIKFLFEILESIIGGILDAVRVVRAVLFPFAFPKRKTELDASRSWKILRTGAVQATEAFTVNGTKFLNIENSMKNQITYGGSGKTTNILISQVLHSLGYASMVINDPSGEIAKVVIPVARKKSCKALVLNYEKHEISCRYNPLARISTVGDAQKVAKMFLAAYEGRSSDPFWHTGGANILSIIFRLLVFHSSKELCTVQNALRILEEMSCGKKVDRLFARVKNDPTLWAAYRSFIANEPKVASSLLATAKNSLTLFQDDSIVRVTAEDELDFSSFRRAPTILFINNNIANTVHYASLTGILLSQFFNELMAELPQPGSLPIFFNIDESASVAYDGLPIIAANCRKYGFSLALFYQSYHQLVGQFNASVAKSVEANMWTRILLPGTPVDIASRVETEMGIFEYQENGVRRTRPLMTSSEIKECMDALVCCGANRFMRLPLHPFHTSKLRKMLSATPYELECRPVSDLPPLIQFT